MKSQNRRKRNSLDLQSIGERGLISRLLPRLTALNPNRFIVPPGDDAAVLKSLARPVLSIDGLTEGTHFKSSWNKNFQKRFGFSFGRALGWKLLGSSLSDLAAMGDVQNRWAMIYLGSPGRVQLRFLNDFYQGVRETAARFNCVLAGGDTVKANELSLVGAVGGELVGPRALVRSTARQGDLICIAGTVGDASVGLSILQGKRSFSSNAESFFVKRFFKHEPLFGQGKILSKENGVTSLIDLSDSLKETVEILCGMSSVGAVIDIGFVPVSPQFKNHVKLDPSILGGGEDYSLMFTIKEESFRRLNSKMKFSVIGKVLPKNGKINFLDRGRPFKCPPFFQHFK